MEIVAEDPATGRRVEVDDWGRIVVRRGDQELLERYVESYDPAWSFGERYTRFFGDEVLMVYVEKHHTIAWVTPAEGRWPASRLISLGSARGDTRDVAVGDDVLAFGGRVPGVVELRWLPGLEAAPPVPATGRVREVAVDGTRVIVDGVAWRLPPRAATMPPRAELVRAVVDELVAVDGIAGDEGTRLVEGVLGPAFEPPAPDPGYDVMFARREWWGEPPAPAVSPATLARVAAGTIDREVPTALARAVAYVRIRAASYHGGSR